MKEGRASYTAAFVAACRSLGTSLPKEAQLAHDPYGARFASASLTPWIGRFPLTSAYVLYMQVRTRALDDVMLAFVRNGGRQIVLLGAGYDCRALRFKDELRETLVFEVDHPDTQWRKREVLGDVASARYLSWDFESQSLDQLGPALASVGHDPAKPSLTIWEGVTMYLTEPAIDATVAAIHAYSAPTSQLAMTYFDRGRMLEKPSWRQRIARVVVSQMGEPFRFGWRPSELAAWFEPRGFEVTSNRAEHELARLLLPARFADRVRDEGRRIAVLTRPR